MANSVPAPTTITSTRNVMSRRLRSELRTCDRGYPSARARGVTPAGYIAIPYGFRALGVVALCAVAEAVHRFDHVGGGAERDAQAAYVHVDGARIDVTAHFPDLLEQLFAREHAARIADEQLEQLVLERAKLRGYAVDLDVV